jgi:serine/threonine-protein kinase
MSMKNKAPPVPPRPAAASGPELRQVMLTPPPEEEGKPAPTGPAPTRLKVVTIDPGRASFPDTELSTGQQRVARQDPYLGATIDGRYKVEALLGEGGMGVVYRCSHTVIGKKVAMKVLRADLQREEEVTERFLNEARAASAIGNPHIIDISDFGQFPDGATYFIMEYLAGMPLSRSIDDGRGMPVERILHIARQLAEGLAAAHEVGIVHRDLKPDNILLVDRGGEKDFVKILDFGIAKVSTADGKLTRAGAVFGTPHYMSPEQAAGAPVDHRGDIYSLGVILYELASGRVPFDADNFMGILTQHMYKAPVPIRALVPEPEGIPPGLEAIVLKCLSKRPDDRYQDMHELIADFDRLQAGSVPEAVNDMMGRSGGFNVPADYFGKSKMPMPMPATPHEDAHGRGRWPLIAGLAGVAAAIGIVVAIFANSSRSSALEAPSATAEPSMPTPAAHVTPPPPEPRVEIKQVMVATEPLDAHLFRGPEDLGPSPVMLGLKPDETATLVARREGFKDASVTIDGSVPRTVVKLERRAAALRGSGRPLAVTKPAQPETAKTKPKNKTPGSGEIVNPWDD